MTSPRALMAAWQLFPSKRLGQNFLVHPAMAQAIVARAKLLPTDQVLEIGAGLGALTVPAARACAAVLAIEKDERLLPLLRAELLAAGITNVTVLAQDIMQADMARLAARADRRLVIMGNLPYNISSQIIVRLIMSRAHIDRAILMLQKEFAQRISAGPGTRQYGRLSVMLGYCAGIETLLSAPATQFYPKPQIDSEVIAISFHRQPPHPADDESFLFTVIKAAFGQRRKTMKNALAGSELHLAPDRAVNALTAAGIDPLRRAETLTVAEFVTLANILGASA